MANALTYQSEFAGQQMDERFTAVATLTAALEALTGVVAQKYVKPSDGIPSTDMTAAVQASLAKAESAVQSLADYYTKTEVDQLLAAINGMDYVDVSTLPAASASTMGKIYLLGPDSSGYYAYYYTSYDGTNYSWVGPLGTTEISLSNYATKAELNQLDQKVDDFVEVMESTDYSEVLIDGEDKMLESRDATGKKKVYTDVEFLGNVKGATVQDAEVKGSIEFVESVVDDDNKMVEATKTNGKKVFFAGIETGDSVPIVPSILYGKKWAVLGDSFTNGGGDNAPLTKGKYKGNLAVYPYIIGNRTGVNVFKFFEGGRTLAWPANPGSFVNSVCNPNATYYYQNIPVDVDYITIYLGINDSQHGAGSSVGEIPIGTISDNTTATYYGAWNVVLAWLLQNRPFAHIGILVSNGCETADWVNAQIAIAKKWGVPYLNLNGDERCPAMIRSWNADLSATAKDIIRQKQAVDPATNTHPNQATHYYESTFIENFLNTL